MEEEEKEALEDIRRIVVSSAEYVNAIPLFMIKRLGKEPTDTELLTFCASAVTSIFTTACGTLKKVGKGEAIDKWIVGTMENVSHNLKDLGIDVDIKVVIKE
jgi:hypothetical protein